MTGIGDSAHATRPDLGQGGAMALEVNPLPITFIEAALRVRAT